MWTELTQIETLDQIIEESNQGDVVIFKHSTRCPISSMALNRVETKANLAAKQINWYFLDLIKYRSISNEIAERFQVEHQSPQVLLIRAGISIYDESHNGISIDALNQNL